METVRFLVIGSSDEFLDRIRQMLQGLDFPVEYQCGITDGVARAQTGEFNVIIIDADIAGFDCVHFMKDLIDTRSADYVLAVTGSNRQNEIASAVGSEVMTCISEPFDMNEFQLILYNIVKVANLKKQVYEKDEQVLQLEVINQIARKTLSCHDVDSLLWDLARLINEHLGYFNVDIFLLNDDGNRIVLRAFAGGFGDDLVIGYSLGLGEGICGWVAANRESLVTGDVLQEPRRLKGFEFEEDVKSEMAVPIFSEDTVYGVIHVESKEKNAFSEQDLMVLETVADQMSLTFENLQLSQALIESKQLTETINDSLPVSIIVLDQSFAVEYANLTFCEINAVRREDVLGKQVETLFSQELFEKIDLTNELKKVIEYGISISHSNIRHTSPYHPERILNITFKHLRVGKSPRIMVLIQDVTEYTQKTYQLLLLREISLAMQGVQERDKLLHLILTCVTAGFAIGFNRAFLFLVDNERTCLRGIMGVGPSSYEEAYRIWNELSSQAHTFQDYLEQASRGDLELSSLQDLASGMSFELATTTNILTETVFTGNYVHVLNAWDDPRVDDKLKTLLASKEFVAVPLIAKNEVIGVLIADNAYSGRNISLDSIEVLTMLGSSAAMAIENANMLSQLEQKIDELERANAELKKAQDMLIRKEKLAAIGEVSARLAHEIRNPLSTIGGFARSIPKRYENRERTIRNANIIVEEVRRLEQILTNVLDYAKPTIPKKSLIDVNALVIDTLGILEGSISESGVIVVTGFEQGLIEAEIDPDQIKQVLINVIQNALGAMSEGGALEIKTGIASDGILLEVIDTGKGIPNDYLENIFEPFFTTRGDGTGLGLSISQMIVQNHGGRIVISSAEGQGTTVSIYLPLK